MYTELTSVLSLRPQEAKTRVTSKMDKPITLVIIALSPPCFLIGHVAR